MSELSVKDTTTWLRHILKHPMVVKEGCRLLAMELKQRRVKAPGMVAIVFVGNDDKAFGDEDDQHANMVKRECESLGLKAIIATSSEGNDGVKNIARFAEGTGDVLVVKQMAGRGLDIDRLKVCLDLSNIRSDNMYIQRSMRIVTIWDRTGNPADVVKTSIYIAPNNCFQADLFQRLVSDEGGEYRGDADWVVTGLAGTGSGGGRPGKYEPEYVPTGTLPPDVVKDSDQAEGPGSMLPLVHDLFEKEPSLANILTEARLCGAFEQAIERHRGTDQPAFHDPPAPADPPMPSTEVVDQNAVLEGLYTQLNYEAAEITRMTLEARYGKQYPSAEYGPTIAKVWVNGGLDRGEKLRSISGERRLNQMLRKMSRQAEVLRARLTDD